MGGKIAHEYFHLHFHNYNIQFSRCHILPQLPVPIPIFLGRPLQEYDLERRYVDLLTRDAASLLFVDAAFLLWQYCFINLMTLHSEHVILTRQPSRKTRAVLHLFILCFLHLFCQSCLLSTNFVHCTTMGRLNYTNVRKHRETSSPDMYG